MELKTKDGDTIIDENLGILAPMTLSQVNVIPKGDRKMTPSMIKEILA